MKELIKYYKEYLHTLWQFVLPILLILALSFVNFKLMTALGFWSLIVIVLIEVPGYLYFMDKVGIPYIKRNWN